jgi:hypothetical protein
MPGLHDGLEIVREEKGNDAALTGAAQLVFQYMSGEVDAVVR